MSENARRTACDRCRELKLRCLRLEERSSDASCARCNRAGALCVTGRARPLGRPRATAPFPETATATAATAHERRKRPCESPLLVARCSADRAPDWSLDGYPTLLHSGPDAVNAVTSTRDLPASRGAASVQHGPLFNMQFSYDNDLLPSFSTADQFPPPNSTTGDGSRSLDFGAEGSIDLSSATRAGDGFGSMADVMGDMPTLDCLPIQQTAESMSDDPIILLSRISESVSCQTASLGTYTWGGGAVCAEKINEVQENPVAQALHTTAEFNRTLETLLARSPSSPNTDSAMSVSNTDLSCSPGGSSFTTPVILLILSVHLQLLVLYDAMTERACQVLREVQDLAKFFRDAPEVTISQGMPAMKGSMYLKLLVQVIEHHIDRAERLVGLPAKYRLSGEPGDTGILSGNLATLNLLKLTMTQLDCTPGRSADTVLASLKSNLNVLDQVVRN
ncbi:hypothetical protein F5Y16DRAFT_63224 [Xylariaceae sp. FL0255]|nr:hypothetical protein F5Y16DRAFT_63224 [Xylariaceae sp. FL0255]